MLAHRQRFYGGDLCIWPHIANDGLLKQPGKVFVPLILMKFVWHIQYYTSREGYLDPS